MWIVNHTRKLGPARRTIQTLPLQLNHKRAPQPQEDNEEDRIRYAIGLPTCTEFRLVFASPVFVCTREILIQGRAGVVCDSHRSAVTQAGVVGRPINSGRCRCSAMLWHLRLDTKWLRYFLTKGFAHAADHSISSQALDCLQRAAPCSFIFGPGQPLVLLSWVKGRASASGRCFRKTSAHFVEVSSGRLRMARSGCPLAQESSVEGRIRRLNI